MAGWLGGWVGGRLAGWLGGWPIGCLGEPDSLNSHSGSPEAALARRTRTPPGTAACTALHVCLYCTVLPACSKLYKEYAIADLSRHREGKVGLRWRTQKEVVSGRGQFICAAKVRVGVGPGGGVLWQWQCGAVLWSGPVCLPLWPALQLQLVAAPTAVSAHSPLSALPPRLPFAVGV